MQSNFLIETQTTGHMLTLALSGELDMLTSPALARALEQLPASDVELIVVDLRGLEFMDSTGLHVLVQGHQQAHESGQRFALVRGGEQIRRVLDLTGVAEAIAIVDSPDELLQADPATGTP